MTNLQSLQDYFVRNHNGIIWRAIDHTVYLDDPSVHIDKVVYDKPILNSQKWAQSRGFKQDNTNQQNNQSMAASMFNSNDPLALTEVFHDPFGDLANQFLTELLSAKKAKDRSKAAAIISSQDYTVLQDAIVVGESVDAIKTGVLTGGLVEQAVPNLKVEWLTYTTGVDFFTFVPEGQAPEPTKGTVASVEYQVGKHMGGVEITERASAIINGDNIFQRLSNELGLKRLQKENALVADEIERATDVVAGVDFGLTSGTPPYNSNRPDPLWLTLQDKFDAVGGYFSQIMSKNQAYNEYANNDFVRGTYTPVNAPQANESVGPTPKYETVTWRRDNAIASATKLWAMDAQKALRGFRQAVRSFIIKKELEETTSQWLKSYYLPKIVDQRFISEVTGITA